MRIVRVITGKDKVAVAAEAVTTGYTIIDGSSYDEFQTDIMPGARTDTPPNLLIMKPGYAALAYRDYPD